MSVAPTLLTNNGGRQFLAGIPVYTTLGSPAQLVLVDLASILISDSTDVEIDVSTQSAIEMDTTPAWGEQSPPSDISVIKSMFQNDLVAIKVLRYISWLRTVNTGVVYMVTGY